MAFLVTIMGTKGLHLAQHSAIHSTKVTITISNAWTFTENLSAYIRMKTGGSKKNTNYW